MSTPAFNEADHPRASGGKFATKNHAEADIDLSDGLDIGSTALAPMPEAEARLAGYLRRWETIDDQKLMRVFDGVDSSQIAPAQVPRYAKNWGVPEQVVWDAMSASQNHITLPENSWPSGCSSEHAELLSQVEQTGWSYDYASSMQGDLRIYDGPDYYVVKPAEVGVRMTKVSTTGRQEEHEFTSVEGLESWVKANQGRAHDAVAARRAESALGLDPERGQRLDYEWGRLGGTYTYWNESLGAHVRATPLSVRGRTQLEQMAEAMHRDPDTLERTLRRGALMATSNPRTLPARLDGPEAGMWSASSSQAVADQVEHRTGAHPIVYNNATLASNPVAVVRADIGPSTIEVGYDRDRNPTFGLDGKRLDETEMLQALQGRAKAKKWFLNAKSNAELLEARADAAYHGF